MKAALPKARVARVDRDLAARRGALAKTLLAFEAGETDILVGTQMIAKGHDFPRVTLVGVVDADVGLGLPDFRAAERTFQLLTQVSGRAGRADLAGEVVLQSHWPDHYALVLACAQDYPAFYEREMEFRRTMGYPPLTALLNVVLRATDAADGRQGRRGPGPPPARETRPAATAFSGPPSPPWPACVASTASRSCSRASGRPCARPCATALVAHFGESRWPGVAVDVDPVSVM